MVHQPDVPQDSSYIEDVSAQAVALNVVVADNEMSDSQNSPIKKVIKQEVIYSEAFNDSEINTKKSALFMPLSDSCMGHSDLFLLEDEKLVKPGDKFESLVHFVQYLNEHAKRWCYYYKCSDSRKAGAGIIESYTYNCVYLKNKDTYVKKGLRKRNNNAKTDCPCKIRVRHYPNEKELTVVYVCNHHDHELSKEGFYKLQHGRRLPPYLKEEIMDFIALHVDLKKIKKYVQYVTGFTMSRPFFYTILKRMKNNNMERQITDKRLKELSDKLSAVENMKLTSDNSLSNDDQDSENMDETLYNSEDNLDEIKQENDTKYKKRSVNTDKIEVTLKKIKKEEDSQNSNQDSESLQNVDNIQGSVKCETDTNTWMSDQCVPVLSNGNLTFECEDELTNKIVQFKILQDPNTTNEDGENIHYIVQYCDENNDNMIVNEHDANTNYILNEESGEIEHKNFYILNESTGEIESTNFILNEQSGQMENSNSYILNETSSQIEEGQDGENETYIEYETINELVSGEQSAGDDAVYENDAAEFEQKPDIKRHNFQSDVEFNANNSQLEQSEDVYETTNTSAFDDSSANNYTSATNECQTQNTTEFNDTTINDGEIVNNSNHNNDPDVDAAVQAFETANPGHSLVPYFDVLMQDGNVTGFVLKNNTLQDFKGFDKEVQTESMLQASTEKNTEQSAENIEIKSKEDCILRISGSTYTKVEYVHKYNIDIYMTQPNFPKYIEILSKEISIDVLEMFANIYKEKAMFKLTTTQTGKNGNTKIWYILDKHHVRKIARRSDNHQRYTYNELFIVQEKNKALKKRNEVLVSKTKYLQNVLSKIITENNARSNTRVNFV